MDWYCVLWDPASMTYLFLRRMQELFLSGLFSFCMRNSSGNLYRGGWGWFSGRRHVTNFLNALTYAVWDIWYIPFKGMFCMCIVWNSVLEWGAEDPGIQGRCEAEELATLPETSSAHNNNLGLSKPCTNFHKASGKQPSYWRQIPLSNLKMLAASNGGWTFPKQTCK